MRDARGSAPLGDFEERRGHTVSGLKSTRNRVVSRASRRNFADGIFAVPFSRSFRERATRFFCYRVRILRRLQRSTGTAIVQRDR